MGSPAVDIKDLLVADSSFTFAENTFVGIIPEETVPSIGVLDSPGQPPEGISDIDYPSVQITILGEPFKYTETYALADTVKNLLHQQGGQTINGTWYLGIWADNDPIFLGLDEKNRPEFSINFRIQRSP